jgi:hypothetical protein
MLLCYNIGAFGLSPLCSPLDVMPRIQNLQDVVFHFMPAASSHADSVPSHLCGSSSAVRKSGGDSAVVCKNRLFTPSACKTIWCRMAILLCYRHVMCLLH